MRVETVVYRGIKFRRYPDSPNYADRNYYRPGMADAAAGVGSLHREVWADHFGPIPDGCEIHHDNRDTADNDPSNLVCLTVEEHRAIHADEGRERSRRPERVAHLESIRPLAAAWHRSDAGRAWHREHARALWVGREAAPRACDYCGGEYATRATQGHERFCSNACKSAARRASGTDDVSRICAHCERPFVVNRSSKSRACSRVCAWGIRRAA